MFELYNQKCNKKYIEQINVLKRIKRNCNGYGNKSQTFTNLVLILLMIFLSSLSFIVIVIYRQRIQILQAAKLAINPASILL